MHIMSTDQLEPSGVHLKVDFVLVLEFLDAAQDNLIVARPGFRGNQFAGSKLVL
jgi:hypothetical protein